MKLFIRISLISLIFLTCTFAEDKKENKMENLILTPTDQLSQKQQAYQKEMKRLEEENQKLEEQGFCSCNNS